MKQQHNWSKQLASLAVAFIFYFLFWDEYLGLNLLVYVSLVIGSLLVFYPELRQSKSFLALASGTILAAVLVLVSNSSTAVFAVFCSFLLMLGMANQPQLKLLLFAAATGVVNLAQGVLEFFASLLRARVSEANRQRLTFYFKVVFIPLVALFVFHVLFSIANERYFAIFEHALEALFTLLERIISEIAIGKIIFFIFGFLITCGSLFLVPYRRFRQKEAALSDSISRSSSKPTRPLWQTWKPGFKILDLKKEYLLALLLLGLVNALLLVVNLIDINWLWFGFVPPADLNLAQFVHEGTYVLIFSILLAMAILLFYFRGNLNFYQQNRWLKIGAYTWIVQNAVLAVSVGLRNYHYINQHGLAYKRIGVIFFLLLTLFGLCTIWFKIEQKRSLYFLLRINTAAAYALMLLMACLNWDSLIAEVNLTHRNPDKIDYQFLISLSDKALDELYQHEHQFTRHDKQTEPSSDRYRNTLHHRIYQFMNDPKRHSWLSWSYPNSSTYHYLKKNYRPMKPTIENTAELTAPAAANASYQTIDGTTE